MQILRVNSCFRTAWLGLLSTFWEQIEDMIMISHLSCNVVPGRVRGRSVFTGPKIDANIEVFGVLFFIERHQNCTHSQNGLEEKKPEWECLFSMTK